MSENRAARRAAAARARDKIASNAERVKEMSEGARTIVEQFEWFRMLLFATARREGRLRVSKEDIDALGENDKIGFVRRDNGDVIVEYTKG